MTNLPRGKHDFPGSRLVSSTRPLGGPRTAAQDRHNAKVLAEHEAGNPWRAPGGKFGSKSTDVDGIPNHNLATPPAAHAAARSKQADLNRPVSHTAHMGKETPNYRRPRPMVRVQLKSGTHIGYTITDAGSGKVIKRG